MRPRPRLARVGARALPPAVWWRAYTAALRGTPAGRDAAAASGRRVPPLVTIVLLVEDRDLPWWERARAAVAAQTWPLREVLIAPVGAGVGVALRSEVADDDPRWRLLPAAPTWVEAADRAARTAHGHWICWWRACDVPAPEAIEALVAASAGGARVVRARWQQRGEPVRWLAQAQERAHPSDDTGIRPVSERPWTVGDLAVPATLVETALWRGRRCSFVEAETHLPRPACDPSSTPADPWLVAPALARLLAADPASAVVDRPVVEIAPEHGHRAFGATPSVWPAWAPALARWAALDATWPAGPLADAWARHVADEALAAFLADLERVDADSWASLRPEAARRLLPPGRSRDVATRLVALLTATGRRPDAESLAIAHRREEGVVPTRVDGDRVIAAWPELPDDLRDHPLLVLDDAETPARARLLRRVGDLVDLDVAVEHLDLAADDRPAELDLDDPGAEVLGAEVSPESARRQAALRVQARVPADRSTIGVGVRVGGVRRVAVLDLTPSPAPEPPRIDAGVTLATVAVEGDALMVGGTGDLTTLRLLDDRDVPLASAGPASNGACLPLRTTLFGREQPLPDGVQRLQAAAGTPLLTPELEARLPLELRTPHHRLTLRRGPYGGLQVQVAAPLAADELGPYHQQRLVDRYRLVERPLDRRTVYFETYVGASATDSALPVHDELRRRRPDLRTVWGIADHSRWTPPGAERVLLRSADWYDTIATAGALVLNTDVELWFRRREGQVVLQTFHGYPSKGMGRGQWEAKDHPPSRIADLRARGVDTWGVILTPTPEMTRHYREQYDYDGPAFEHGYPRDDALTAPDAPLTRSRTRALLGIDDDRVAVLYAPTWREQLAVRARRAEFADHLDVAAAAQALGERYVLLLRGHRFHRPAGVRGPAGARVVDVTAYPEINDLVLAADAAVLDYSSLRFDVALAGVPSVFLVPDLEEYARGTRQFLYPFEDSAPGPLVASTGEVVAHLRDLPALRAAWTPAIEAFNARYHPYQDGAATARVVDGLLAMLPDAGA
ncbi:hypothetical protein GCM10022215_06820 [Nocardioides fonticola]|uniref:CDP-glycerol glycerophosphotransferase n=1 Tax=Nocardioides fonticola TaxID=450363 RepID=A0ABP7XC47_9ACTN